MYCTENKLGVSHSDGNFSIQDAKNSTQISNYENPPSLFFECLRKEAIFKNEPYKKTRPNDGCVRKKNDTKG
ncbi:hypothetical protein CWI38_0645p0010 [Hamiltosporidium tvaerminnensis]|uniref:Uncharacterized protein n=1 Tax=Hamiltosporidium tvaerminnensis TaxID=1176355 RepID=A0A4Q9LVV3_9MICR|nr:hypothetical protein CWI38_0645p0010 [Hamiltosporidium tvaerminnensis]